MLPANAPAFAANENETTPSEIVRVLYPGLQRAKVVIAGLLFWVPKCK